MVGHLGETGEPEVRKLEARGRGAVPRHGAVDGAVEISVTEMHGGRIWVKSEVGRGSTFTFTLPERAVSLSGH